MSRVFVIQVPSKKVWPEGIWVEKYDLSPAERYGQMVRVLPPGNVPADPGPTRKLIAKSMHDFDHDQDFMLLLGDPVACALAVFFLAADLEVPDFKVLKWDRRQSCYFPYLVC